MGSKLYPDPSQQISAGYFWLGLGLAISFILLWFQPFGVSKFMWGLSIYGLFHVVQGRKNLRNEIALDNARIERYLSGEVKFPEDFER